MLWLLLCIWRRRPTVAIATAAKPAVGVRVQLMPQEVEAVCHIDIVVGPRLMASNCAVELQLQLGHREVRPQAKHAECCSLLCAEALCAEIATDVVTLIAMLGHASTKLRKSWRFSGDAPDDDAARRWPVTTIWSGGAPERGLPSRHSTRGRLRSVLFLIHRVPGTFVSVLTTTAAIAATAVFSTISTCIPTLSFTATFSAIAAAAC